MGMPREAMMSRYQSKYLHTLTPQRISPAAVLSVTTGSLPLLVKKNPDFSAPKRMPMP